jgi:hypothetical protein
LKLEPKNNKIINKNIPINKSKFSGFIITHCLFFITKGAFNNKKKFEKKLKKEKITLKFEECTELYQF